jgi:hypothetical protein
VPASAARPTRTTAAAPCVPPWRPRPASVHRRMYVLGLCTHRLSAADSDGVGRVRCAAQASASSAATLVFPVWPGSACVHVHRGDGGGGTHEAVVAGAVVVRGRSCGCRGAAEPAQMSGWHHSHSRRLSHPGRAGSRTPRPLNSNGLSASASPSSSIFAAIVHCSGSRTRDAHSFVYRGTVCLPARLSPRPIHVRLSLSLSVSVCVCVCQWCRQVLCLGGADGGDRCGPCDDRASIVPAATAAPHAPYRRRRTSRPSLVAPTVYVYMYVSVHAALCVSSLSLSVPTSTRPGAGLWPTRAAGAAGRCCTCGTSACRLVWRTIHTRRTPCACVRPRRSSVCVPVVRPVCGRVRLGCGLDHIDGCA